jgi:transglutaminase-like putative cysteine protease
MSSRYGRARGRQQPRMNKLCLLLASAVVPLIAADDTPNWVREIASTKLPAYPAKVPAVVLLKEQRTSIDDAGRRTTTTRTAIKILTKEGAGAASGSEAYWTDTAKVKDIRAWMVYGSSGNVKKYGKEDIVDAAMSSGNELYSQGRIKIISGRRDADVGNVFAFESTAEDKTVFAQEQFIFQGSLPVVIARFALTVPNGWTAKAVILNHPAIEPTVSSGTYTWQLNDMPYVDDEEASPSSRAILPRIAVGYVPPSGVNVNIRPLSDWSSVGKWMSELADPKTQPNPAIEAKAKALTADAKTELEKIQAIGRYVQGLNYILITRGEGRGGGYTPHAAADIFQKGYGDCKDKTTLMRSMLKTIGIESTGVGIYSGDRTAVKPEWPSPHQFNHAITAIRVSDATKAPAVMNVDKIGRILFFDPTDPHTPVGYLPTHEQASHALVEHAEHGVLVVTPATPPTSTDIIRKGEAVMNADGGLSGSLVETRRGAASARLRGLHKELPKADFDKYIERWLASSIPGVHVKKIAITDTPEEFQTTVEFETERFAQVPNTRMRIFRASLFRHPEVARLNEKIRKQPVVLNSDAFEEEIKILLPEGFKIDELPDPLARKSEYGTFQAKWEPAMGSLIFKRKLEMGAKTVDAAEYLQVKKFFDTVYGGSEQPVVLMR